MTYNFDPDNWYENERAHLESRHRRGELSDDELEAAVAVLDDRYEAMLERLDGTYSLPEG